MNKQDTTVKRLRGSIDFKVKKADQETPKGKSLTVPDDSYTIQELLEKHQMGITTMSMKQGYYIEDTDIDDIDMEKFGRSDHGEKHQSAEYAKETRELYKKGKAEKEAKTKSETEEKMRKEKEKKDSDNQEIKKDQASK